VTSRAFVWPASAIAAAGTIAKRQRLWLGCLRRGRNLSQLQEGVSDSSPTKAMGTPPPTRSLMPRVSAGTGTCWLTERFLELPGWNRVGSRAAAGQLTDVGLTLSEGLPFIESRTRVFDRQQRNCRANVKNDGLQHGLVPRRALGRGLAARLRDPPRLRSGRSLVVLRYGTRVCGSATRRRRRTQVHHDQPLNYSRPRGVSCRSRFRSPSERGGRSRASRARAALTVASGSRDRPPWERVVGAPPSPPARVLPSRAIRDWQTVDASEAKQSQQR
jgi:hypothetical protein